MAYNNLTQLMGLGGAYGNIQQQSLQGRNPYQTGYPPNSAQAMGGHPGGHPGMFNAPGGYQQVISQLDCTDDSLSKAIIFASTNPQYDDRLFIELQVQYMKIASSEHVLNKQK